MINLITEHIDIWTAAQTQKTNGNRGRGNGSANQSPHGIKKLRELILELAIRGKLVSQDPNDEPASVLLEKIAKERDELIKEKKIKRPKILPEITDEEKPFYLQIGWQFVRLNDLGEWGAGATPTRNRHDYYGGDIPWFKSGELVGDYISSSEERVTELALKESSLRYNKTGDVLIAMYGATIGKTSILKVPATTNQAVCACTPFNGIYNVFLLTLLKAYKNRFIEMGAGGAQPNISREKIIATVIALPPLAEQHRIVAKVDELMALCDQLEQKQTDSNAAHKILIDTFLATLTSAADKDEFIETWERIAENFDALFTTEHSIDQLKQTILQLAVMGKLVPQDPNDEPASVLLEKIAKEKARLIKESKIKKQKIFHAINEEEKLFELPDGWAWARITDVGHDWGQKKPEKDFTYIDVSSIDNVAGIVRSPNKLTAAEAPSRARKIVKVGTVIYSTVRPYLKNICVIDQEYSPEPIASTAFAVLHPLQQLPGKFFTSYLRSPVFVKYVESVQTGIAYPAINDKQFFSGLIPIPPLAEQHRIVAKVDELMAICDTLKARLYEAQTTQVQSADAIVEQAVA